MFFEKHTKYCTLLMIIHNICSCKDILLQELQRGVELLRLKNLFIFTRKTGKKKKHFCASYCDYKIDKMV
jgi:hypothetical protein